MNRSLNMAAIRHQFQVVGAALMRADLNNTHSGNISLRDPSDPGRFFITASGAMCGALAPDEIVPVRFADMSWSGPRRPSSETNTHRAVLNLPGVQACVHCHAPAATVVSLESPEKPVVLIEAGRRQTGDVGRRFQPVDLFGAGLIGDVGVGAYAQSVSSREMQASIPRHLSHRPLTLVMGHGPFARGANLAECLHCLSVLENSSRLALALRRRGVALAGIQRRILENGFDSFFPERPRVPDLGPAAPPQGQDSSQEASFAYWLAYGFDLGLGAFATGSMSRREGPDEMLFCPMAAAPAGVAAPLFRLPVRGGEPQAADIRMHRRIYAQTPYTACVIAPSPLATAEAAAVLSEAGTPAAAAAGGAARAAELPVIVPIDAEASYYGVRLPVAPLAAIGNAAREELIAEMLRRGDGCGVIAGYGVIAAGEGGLAQAFYRLTLAERIARFRQEAHLHHTLLGAAAPAEFEKR
ncbi:MAG: class II aldolase/adducin family protein [Desulfobacterales bacterium]|jgi:L-fuculose-phosphate aldolase|nr:class II aldolase/adducin family protein [Desulfobacterales bacterium]